jgi:hypothetical protein
VTHAFLTIDTEFAWRHHQAGYDCDEIYRRSIEPARVGIGYQLARLAEHRLKACFFVDPMSALTFGLDHVCRIVDTILSAGQEVQLHLHPNWTAARPSDGGHVSVRYEMCDYTRDEQRALIAGAAELLVAAGAPDPIAFRAGSYSANDHTLEALAEVSIAYDSSHNGACHPWPSGIELDPRRIAPVERAVIEVPVTVIEDAPGELRTAQICALSTAEMRATIAHAAQRRHAAITIVGHSFELANRAGTRPNAVHVRRFDLLCEMLDDARDAVPTAHFADRPDLALGQNDAPLGPNRFRKRWRQAEQLWSNWVEERAA